MILSFRTADILDTYEKQTSPPCIGVINIIYPTDDFAIAATSENGKFMANIHWSHERCGSDIVSKSMEEIMDRILKHISNAEGDSFSIEGETYDSFKERITTYIKGSIDEKHENFYDIDIDQDIAWWTLNFKYRL